MAKCFLRSEGDFHHAQSLRCGASIPMWKPLTGYPCAGESHARFGWRGGESLPAPYNVREAFVNKINAIIIVAFCVLGFFAGITYNAMVGSLFGYTNTYLSTVDTGFLAVLWKYVKYSMIMTSALGCYLGLVVGTCWFAGRTPSINSKLLSPFVGVGIAIISALAGAALPYIVVFVFAVTVGPGLIVVGAFYFGFVGDGFVISYFKGAYVILCTFGTGSAAFLLNNNRMLQFVFFIYFNLILQTLYSSSIMHPLLSIF